MEYVPQQQEQQLRTFHSLLEKVVTVDDMFPPDDDGVHEMRDPTSPRPSLVGRLVMVGEV